MREESAGRGLKGASGGRWPAAVLAALLSLIVYWATAAPGTLLQESNYDLTVAAVSLGCAHSPGYPLHTLAAHPLVTLLAGHPALATNLLSGLFGALTVLFL
ncbi:DUF2723 domain-containing protein, partial [bacterium]|nr:DUF2723 domain-containing protein [bacterium]